MAQEDEPEGTFSCEECHQVKDLEEARMVKGGGAVCESCADNSYFSCDCCELYYKHEQERSACDGCLTHAKNIIHV